ncbi:RidA family protein [Phytohabitans flavus]|uniref:RidA family protein n=1 Tax=Phytohabitans flavus TaxID=1076124 RepID=UPI0031E7031B
MPADPHDGNTARFSPSMRAGDLVFVSGQASVDEAGRIVPGTFEEEMRRSIDNVRRVLAAEGLTLADVVKVNAFVRDEDRLGEYNRIYAEYFTDNKPARTTITNCLTKQIQFEVDVVAYVARSPQ